MVPWTVESHGSVIVIPKTLGPKHVCIYKHEQKTKDNQTRKQKQKQKQITVIRLDTSQEERNKNELKTMLLDGPFQDYKSETANARHLKIYLVLI